jgi:phosphotransferase system  glucose/maltose/N-acetylglucosamine-specific IIC component
MDQMLMHLAHALERLPDERGFLAGRVVLVVVILAVIVIAAVIAFIIPGS